MLFLALKRGNSNSREWFWMDKSPELHQDMGHPDYFVEFLKPASTLLSPISESAGIVSC